MRVLVRLADGHPYKAIATELHPAPFTIEHYARELRRRLKVDNNAALAAFAVIAGLLSADCWPPQLTGLAEVDVSLLPD